MPSGSLEQQAMDRVARMYSSFDRRQPPAPKESGASANGQNGSDAAEKASVPQAHDNAREQSEGREEPRPQSGFLELLMKDKDQSLILLLLVILMKDGADMNLILALIYLLI